MRNARLVEAMAAKGWTNERLAISVGVDPKTVERWVNLGRVPHRATARAVADRLDSEVLHLWPNLRRPGAIRGNHPELLALYSRRCDVPSGHWGDMISRARSRIDILVYAALFLHEQIPDFTQQITEKARENCRIRINIADPDSETVAARGREENFGEGIQSRCRLAAKHYAPLHGLGHIELRRHETTLYNSIYRIDEEMLVNSHMWGVAAFGAPVWHLRRAEGGNLFDAYIASFEEVWAQSHPLPAC